MFYELFCRFYVFSFFFFNPHEFDTVDLQIDYFLFFGQANVQFACWFCWVIHPRKPAVLKTLAIYSIC